METKDKKGTANAMDSKGYESGSVGLYVGTYHKYNCGSLDGRWWYLCNYADIDDLLADIEEYHNDEHDPEYMVQDWDNLPHGFYASSLGECLNKPALEFMHSLETDSDGELVAHYLDATGQDWDDFENFEDAKEKANDAVVGYLDPAKFYDFDDWAVEHFLEGVEVPDYIEHYLDHAKIARDMQYDYHCTDKFVFSAY